MLWFPVGFSAQTLMGSCKGKKPLLPVRVPFLMSLCLEFAIILFSQSAKSFQVRGSS